MIVLSGGCFQNPILLDGLERSLAAEGQVIRPQKVPPGDGGLALGQAWVAGARSLQPSQELEPSHGREET